MPKLSALEQIKRLKRKAVAELLAQKDTIEAQLRELGHYGTKPKKAKPCKVCGSFEHDARHHRAENIARKKRAPHKRRAGKRRKGAATTAGSGNQASA